MDFMLTRRGILDGFFVSQTRERSTRIGIVASKHENQMGVSTAMGVRPNGGFTMNVHDMFFPMKMDEHG